MFVSLLRFPLPPARSAPGAVPGCSSASRPGRAPCWSGERPQPLLAGSRHSSSPAGQNREIWCRCEKSAAREAENILPSHHSGQGKQRGSLPAMEAFLHVEITVETKRLSCLGALGVISPRGQKGTPQIAVSRVAIAPQGRSCHLGAIHSKGEVGILPLESFCVSCPYPGSWLPPASATQLLGPRSSPTFAVSHQYTKGVLERDRNPFLLALHSIRVVRAIIC